MYIVRWLIGHPIVAIWVLVSIGLLSVFYNSGDKQEIAPQLVEKNIVVTSIQQKDTEEMSDTLEEITTAENTSIKKEIAKDKASSDDEIVNTLEKVTGSELPKNKTFISKPAVPESNVISRELVDAKKLTKETIKSVEANVDADTEELDIVQKTTTSTVKVTENKIVKDVVVEEKITEKEELGRSVSSVNEKLGSDGSAIQDLKQSTPEEMLKMAREAYWNNGLDEAAQIYQQLIALEPDTIEHKGELGNVYWRQGYPKKAAELYSEIAIPMIKTGNSERVSNMIGFIGLFYPDRAAKIYKMIQLKK